MSHPWSLAHDEKLRALRAAGVPYDDIAPMLGRTVRACRGHMEALVKHGSAPPRGLWTAEAKAQVAEMWMGGQSALEITRALGLKSRSQVIGIVHRMGLKRPDGLGEAVARFWAKQNGRKGNIARYGERAPKLPKAVKAPRPRREPIEPRELVLRAVQDGPVKPDRRPLRCAPVEPLNVSLMDLARRACRYPTSQAPNGDHLFCGHEAHDSSWCVAHQSIAFTPSSDKRKATLRDLERMARRAA